MPTYFESLMRHLLPPCWEVGGGGSFYEKAPSYQRALRYRVRVVPDVSLDSNPITGLLVWDSFSIEELGAGWFIVGGTSAATPTWAGIVNRAGLFASSSVVELAGGILCQPWRSQELQ